MSGCGGLCALSIWFIFLYPVIATVVFNIINKKKLVNKAKFTAISIIGGYVFLVGTNFLLPVFAKLFQDFFLSDGGMDILMTISLGSFLIPQVIFSYFLMKKYFLKK